MTAVRHAARARLVVLALLGSTALWPAPARAQITLAEGDDAVLALSGYLRSLTGIADQGFDLPGVDRRSGFHGEVVRLKWTVAGGAWSLEVHNRLQASVSSRDDATGQVIGFGVSAVPDRSLDLGTVLLDESGLHAWHDVDRLNVRLLTDAVDLTFGRQAITWGTSAIFPVADLWSRFSPFELDTEEKPGIDAIRALFYPGDGLEMDAVVADRGSLDHLSAGLRGTWSLPAADVWAGAGKFWRELIAMGGATLLRDDSRVRAELAVPWDMDDRSFQDPRATLGVDWLGSGFTITAEYHFNGIGAGDPAAYVDRLADPRFARGESYYLGRHYLGAAASWSPDQQNRLGLALSALANLGDGSVAITPIASYDLGQATRVSVGGFVSLGQTPEPVLPIRLDSEFGTYGELLFTRLSVYF